MAYGSVAPELSEEYKPIKFMILFEQCNYSKQFATLASMFSVIFLNAFSNQSTTRALLVRFIYEV